MLIEAACKWKGFYNLLGARALSSTPMKAVIAECALGNVSEINSPIIPFLFFCLFLFTTIYICHDPPQCRSPNGSFFKYSLILSKVIFTVFLWGKKSSKSWVKCGSWAELGEMGNAALYLFCFSCGMIFWSKSYLWFRFIWNLLYSSNSLCQWQKGLSWLTSIQQRT